MKLNLDQMPHQRAVTLRARPNHPFDPASIGETLSDIVRLTRPLSPVAVCSVGISPDVVRVLIGLLSQQGVAAQASDLPPGFPLQGRNAAIVILATTPKPQHSTPLKPQAPGLPGRASQPGQNAVALLGGRASQPGQNAAPVIGGRALRPRTPDTNAGLSRVSTPGRNFRG